MYLLFVKYKKYLVVTYWLVTGTITATINSYSVLGDNQRRGLSFATWEPFVWEFSSQLSILMLIPLILYLDKKRPLKIEQFKFNIGFHLIFSLVFSILHVLLMVAMRQLCYFLNDGNYDFGDWQSEMVYEYRKDLLTYIQILSTFYIYRFIVSRLLSEAREIGLGEDFQKSTYVERLIIKKIGKEFIIKISDIEWIEASGNYMNLFIGERCYPFRSTMSALIGRLDPKQFVRVHRSSIVNIDVISEILPLESGDYQIKLNHGKKIRLSRRYRENIKSLLSE
jgi:hypothetical protein